MKPSDILEGLDPQQKAAGQLGPTEKVKNNNIGKLVGANENFINTDVQAVVTEEDLDEHNHLIGVYRKGESQFQLWNEGQYQYKLTSMVGGVPKQFKKWDDFDLDEVKADLAQLGFQSMRTYTDESEISKFNSGWTDTDERMLAASEDRLENMGYYDRVGVKGKHLKHAIKQSELAKQKAQGSEEIKEGECPACAKAGNTCKECSAQMESLSHILRNAGI